jgi:hypothetical protein
MKNIDDEMKKNLEIMNQMKQNFDQMMKINQQTIANLPDNIKIDKSDVLNDLNKIKKLVMKNDMDSLNKLARKYANNDPK